MELSGCLTVDYITSGENPCAMLNGGGSVISMMGGRACHAMSPLSEWGDLSMCIYWMGVPGTCLSD